MIVTKQCSAEEEVAPERAEEEVAPGTEGVAVAAEGSEENSGRRTDIRAVHPGEEGGGRNPNPHPNR